MLSLTVLGPLLRRFISNLFCISARAHARAHARACACVYNVHVLLRKEGNEEEVEYLAPGLSPDRFI